MGRIYRIYLFLILLVPLFSQEEPTLAQFPFRTFGEADGQLALLLQETMLGELSHSGYVTIKDLWNSELEAEEALIIQGLTRETLIQIGQEQEVDFFLTGALAYHNNRFELFYQVYSSVDGICLIARKISAPISDVLEAAAALSDQISRELYWVFSVDQNRYIETMISLENYDEAYQYINARKHIENTSELKILSERVADEEKDRIYREFQTALEEGDLDRAFFLLRDIQNRYGDDRKATRALDDFLEVTSREENLRYRAALDRFEELLQKGDYEELDNYWENFIENYSSQSEIDELQQWEYDVRSREVQFLMAKGDQAYIEASDDQQPFQIRLKNAFKAQVFYFQAYTIHFDSESLKAIERCNKLQNRLYKAQYRNTRDSDFFEQGLREQYYLSASAGLVSLSDPYYSLGGLNDFAPQLNLDLLRLVPLKNHSNIGVNGGLSLGQQNFTSSKEGTDYDTKMLQVLLLGEVSYYHNWKYLDLWGGPGAALGYRQLDSQQENGLENVSESWTQILPGMGLQIGAALHLNEKWGLQLRIRSYRVYSDRGGLLPQTSVDLGLRYGFSFFPEMTSEE